MVEKIIKVKLDINKYHPTAVCQHQEFSQGDTGNIFIEAEVYDKGKPIDLIGYEAVVRYANQKNPGFGDTMCEIVGTNGNIVRIEVFGVVLAVAGQVTAQITLSHPDGQQISIQPFYFNVKETINSSNTYQPDETMPIMQQQQRRIKELEMALSEKAGVVVE